ncbi:hypothetical protein BSKO_05601 [Bryopsis sp. KO-2023]|nr:hypothetical protein BSKO_05601 [Bryopsis sp. KO-2023]
MASSQDPFHLVKKEIQDAVNDVQGKFARWSGLTSTNPERMQLSSDVEKGCASVMWQLDELSHAIEKASENPSRFNLTQSELESRTGWLESTKAQISNVQQSLKVANQRARFGDGQNPGLVSRNDQYVSDQRMQQEMIVRQQDEDLDEMGKVVDRLGQVGLTIHDELSHQQRMLDDLDEDLDITTNRMRAAQRKIADIIKKSGGKWQFCTIVLLSILLIVLVLIAFS